MGMLARRGYGACSTSSRAQNNPRRIRDCWSFIGDVRDLHRTGPRAKRSARRATDARRPAGRRDLDAADRSRRTGRFRHAAGRFGRGRRRRPFAVAVDLGRTRYRHIRPRRRLRLPMPVEPQAGGVDASPATSDLRWRHVRGARGRPISQCAAGRRRPDHAARAAGRRARRRASIRKRSSGARLRRHRIFSQRTASPPFAGSIYFGVALGYALIPNPEHSTVPSSWYGWQPLLSDLGAAALASAGSRNQQVIRGAVALYLLPSPIIHFAHRNYKRAILSAALRGLLPYLLDKTFAKPDPDGGYDVQPADAIVTGAVIAALVDDLLLARN